jgi:elongation factor Ts
MMNDEMLTRNVEMATTAITADLVKKLRDATGAGMMECKGALTEANGDLEAATTLLRKRGLAAATKKAGRSTSEGLIGHYIHMGGKIGVLVEVNCESDFVARTDKFQELTKEIAMHIAAANPTYVRREEVPADVIAREKEIYREQVKDKPAQVIDKIVDGKLNSYYQQFCLLEQPSVRDPNVSIQQLIQDAIRILGENITISRFTRMKVGEPG